MARPQIRPEIFIALQNGLAALLAVALLVAELNRRLLFAHPQVDLFWQVATLANRTVLPVLNVAETFLVTPDKLLAGLVAAVAIPLLAWWSRYWFATALSGHMALAAVIIMIRATFRRGYWAVPDLDLATVLAAMRPGIGGVVLLALAGLLLVMCLADHVAFLRFLGGFIFRRRGKAAA